MKPEFGYVITVGGEPAFILMTDKGEEAKQFIQDGLWDEEGDGNAYPLHTDGGEPIEAFRIPIGIY